MPLDDINDNYGTTQRWDKVKYNKEIRLSLGCCLVRDKDGELYSKRLPIYDYTNRWVVTITQYEDECIPNQIRKIKETGPRKGWVEGDHTEADGIFDEDPVLKIKGIGKGKVKVLA